VEQQKVADATVFILVQFLRATLFLKEKVENLHFAASMVKYLKVGMTVAEYECKHALAIGILRSTQNMASRLMQPGRQSTTHGAQ
jgi:hypothetical protein